KASETPFPHNRSDNCTCACAWVVRAATRRSPSRQQPTTTISSSSRPSTSTTLPRTTSVRRAHTLAATARSRLTDPPRARRPACQGAVANSGRRRCLHRAPDSSATASLPRAQPQPSPALPPIDQP
ncbi:hypothetical protein AMAG_17909, partial [Allomyces macrogynus ATCC 38327]